MAYKFASNEERKQFVEDIKADFEVGEADLAKIAYNIFMEITAGKHSVENPTAFVIAGQPGAGKTGIMKESCKQFGGNFIVYDIDEFREFHPKIEEIKSKYPDFYVDLTSKFASDVSHVINPIMFEGKYNMGLHKTFGNELLIDDTLLPLRKLNYNVVLRVMATSDLESKMSALERSQKLRITDKISRWVYKPYMDKVMTGLVNMCQKAENEKLVDVIQVVRKNCQPIDLACVYQKDLTGKVPQEIYQTSYLDLRNEGHKSVSDAIVKARHADAMAALPFIDEKIEKADIRAKEYSEATGESRALEDAFLSEIQALAEKYRGSFEFGG